MRLKIILILQCWGKRITELVEDAQGGCVAQGFVTSFPTCCVRRALRNRQPSGKMLLSPHGDIWVMLGGGS